MTASVGKLLSGFKSWGFKVHTELNQYFQNPPAEERLQVPSILDYEVYGFLFSGEIIFSSILSHYLLCFS